MSTKIVLPQEYEHREKQKEADQMAQDRSWDDDSDCLDDRVKSNPSNMNPLPLGVPTVPVVVNSAGAYATIGQGQMVIKAVGKNGEYQVQKMLGYFSKPQ